MPVVGWLAGRSLAGFIGAFDHWVAFGLLAFLGAKMVLDSLTGFETGEARLRRPSREARLIILSVATSIDALAVGLSLALLGVQILEPALVIGVVTAVLCAVGIKMGDRIGVHLGHWAEACGGAILCLIGLSILAEHLS
jgi:putative Mn2+ efflux pump MntP